MPHPPSPPDPPAYASATTTFLGALQAFLPPDRIGVAEWAAHRRMTGAIAGPWRPETAPYLQEPMHALTSGEHTTVAVVGPGQCGKTAIAENWLLQSIETDPAPFGWYLNTDDVVKAYVRRPSTPSSKPTPPSPPGKAAAPSTTPSPSSASAA